MPAPATSEHAHPRSIVVTLPWPAPLLWPNARPRHWSHRSNAVRRARSDAARAALEAGAIRMRAAFGGEGPIRMHLEFRPGPRQRESDDDNRIAAMKPHRDGIADALKVDDRRFRVTASMGARGTVASVIATITVEPLMDGVKADG